MEISKICEKNDDDDDNSEAWDGEAWDGGAWDGGAWDGVVRNRKLEAELTSDLVTIKTYIDSKRMG